MKFITAEQLSSLKFNSQQARDEVTQFFTDLANNKWNWNKVFNGSTFGDTFRGLQSKYLSDGATIQQVLEFKATNERKEQVARNAGSFDNSVFKKGNNFTAKDKDCVDCFDDPDSDKLKRNHGGKGIPVLGGGYTSDLGKKYAKEKVVAKIASGDVFRRPEEQVQHAQTDVRGNTVQTIGTDLDVALEPLKDIKSKRAFTSFLIDSANGNTGMIPAHLNQLHLTLTGVESEAMSDKDLKNLVYDLVQDWREKQED